MFKPALLLPLLILGASVGLYIPRPASPRQLEDRVTSDHIRVRISVEREWLGRDAVNDLERCWQFMERATNSMPRRILIIVSWDSADTTTDYDNGTIRIGMDQPATASDARSVLLHCGGREMARLGLLGLSMGRAAREESSFLLEGMSELLVHEFEASNRNLGGVWVMAHMLGRMGQLGFAQQSRWSDFAGTQHSLRTAAPGATFLITCRELRGRDSLFKFFDSLKDNKLPEALSAAFKTTPAVLESTWLKRVRDYDVSQDVTATTEEDAPYLEKATAAGSAGKPLVVRLYLKDRASNLLPEGVFVQDTKSGQVVQARAGSDGVERFFAVEVPIEAGRQAGSYELAVTAVDEAGNVRNWKTPYSVQ